MTGKKIVFIDSGCEIPDLGRAAAGVEFVKAGTADSAAELGAALDAARRGEGLVAYAVVTRDPSKFADVAISNNIVREAGPEETGKAVGWTLSLGRPDPESGVFFCSDLHFNHANIIKYCGRPWNSGRGPGGEVVVSPEDVERMNEDLVRNFNETVPEGSTVWFLGDFCMGPDQRRTIPEFVSRLHGKINIVLGNHDRHSVKFYYDAGFHRVYDRPVVVNGFVVLSHAPLEFVKAPFFNVYGHVHDCASYKTWSADSCCVCVERHGYRPVPLEAIMKKAAELRGII
jgi:calcineurin-like phosphoesterase family protein